MKTFDNFTGKIIDHDKIRLPGLKALYGENTYQCPRCGYPLMLIAEHAFSELYECKQCGYTKQVKQ